MPLGVEKFFYLCLVQELDLFRQVQSEHQKSHNDGKDAVRECSDSVKREPSMAQIRYLIQFILI